MMEPTVTGANIFGGAAIIGVVAGFWNYIKIYASKIFSLFVVRVEINGSAAEAISTLLNLEFKCSPLGKKLYVGENEYVRPKRRNQIVGFERIPNEATIWWRGKRPLIVSGDTYSLNLTFIRGIYQRDKFIVEAIDKFNKEKNRKNWKEGDRFRIKKKYGSIGSGNKLGSNSNHGKLTADAPDEVQPSSGGGNKYTMRPLGWSREEIGQPKNKGAIDKLSLHSGAVNAMQEAFLWRDSEYWFKERSIPWKRGWLLYGAPGCVLGNTKIKIRKISNDNNHRIITKCKGSDTGNP